MCTINKTAFACVNAHFEVYQREYVGVCVHRYVRVCDNIYICVCVCTTVRVDVVGMPKSVITSDVCKIFSGLKLNIWALYLLYLFSSHLDTANSISTPANSQSPQGSNRFSTMLKGLLFVQNQEIKFLRAAPVSVYQIDSSGIANECIAYTIWTSRSNLRMRKSTYSTCETQLNIC